MANSKLKFAANISTMFTEFPDICERYMAAKRHNFEAVECQFPYETNVDLLVAAKNAAGVQHILLNSYPGEEDDFGLACVPGMNIQFIQSLHKAVAYANFLNCKYVHVIGGLMDTSKFCEEDYYDTYLNSLMVAGEFLEEHGKIGLIEPIGPYLKSNYCLYNFEKAIEILQQVDSPHIKLLLDVYHLHMIYPEENVVKLLAKYYKYAGHIQVSQAPDRNEPLSMGEINYKEVFSFLEQQGHKDFIGLEYKPSGSTAEGLALMQPYGII